MTDHIKQMAIELHRNGSLAIIKNTDTDDQSHMFIERYDDGSNVFAMRIEQQSEIEGNIEASMLVDKKTAAQIISVLALFLAEP